MGRRVVAVVIALVVALVGAVAVVGYARAADSRAVAGQQTVDVYLSTAKVPAGTTAREAANRKLIVLKPVVAKGVPAGALTTIDPQTEELVATSAIMPGEVVLASRFAKAGPKEKMAKAPSNGVPDGKVAITASLADPQRVAPFLTPGSHIVIYDSFNPRNLKASVPTPDGGKLRDDAPGLRVTRVVLDDVVVIGVGSAKAATGSTPTPAPTGDAAPDAGNAALVTVAVTPKQAITLVHAIQTGTLYAGLLGPSAKVDRNAVVNDDTVLSK